MTGAAAYPAPDRLMIRPGLFLDEADTLERCEIELDGVAAAIVRIENQLMQEDGDETWRIAAATALRAKKYAMPRLQQRVAEFRRAARAAEHAAMLERIQSARVSKDSALVRTMYEIAPDVATKVAAFARERHPELFEEVA